MTPRTNMKTRTRTILAAVAAALLCAQMPAADNGTGKIVVYYTGSFISGAHQTEDVYLITTGGHQEVQLHANRYHEFVVAPGRHTLIAHHLMSQDAIEVDVKNGETVYVEDHPSIAHWNFEVSEDQAHAKLRVSQLKPQN
jgi:hypothetical protein